MKKSRIKLCSADQSGSKQHLSALIQWFRKNAPEARLSEIFEPSVDGAEETISVLIDLRETLEKQWTDHQIHSIALRWMNFLLYRKSTIRTLARYLKILIKEREIDLALPVASLDPTLTLTDVLPAEWLPVMAAYIVNTKIPYMHKVKFFMKFPWTVQHLSEKDRTAALSYLIGLKLKNLYPRTVPVRIEIPDSVLEKQLPDRIVLKLVKEHIDEETGGSIFKFNPEIVRKRLIHHLVASPEETRQILEKLKLYCELYC